VPGFFVIAKIIKRSRTNTEHSPDLGGAMRLLVNFQVLCREVEQGGGRELTSGLFKPIEEIRRMLLSDPNSEDEVLALEEQVPPHDRTSKHFWFTGA